MIPVDNTQTIEGAGEAVSIGKVTATARNLPLLINLVTDRIYKDKVKAIIREYSTNAWDAHIEAGLTADQIQVYLPTLVNPVLRIRDFGAGLTMEQVRDIYCILGESTKRGTNSLNGQLGLGCKSAFGYGDSFLVTSWVNGTKTVYNIIKGDDEKEGDVLRISQSSMESDDRTGIEISIPINIGDLSSVHSKAVDFYKYWEILPIIHNMDEEYLSRMNSWRNDTPFLSGEGWEIRPNSNHYGSGVSVAFMGQVAYPIDWGMLQSKLALTPQKRVFSEILRSNDVILRFPIGALKFLPNREELEYTETTYKNLENMVERIFSTLELAVKEKFSNAGSIWEAKRIYLSLFGKNIGDRDETEVSNTLKILDGDFHRLEDMFKGKLTWNNITINSPYFSNINRFDYNYPDEVCEDDHNPEKPCMVTYKRKKSRVTALNCENSENNKIVPYNRIKVVIIDDRNASMTRTVARYFLLGQKEKVDKVHFLRFANSHQKDLFFEEYHFDTAEFTLLSDIVTDVKEWQKLNRKTYAHGSGERTLLQYIDLETFKIEESEVALRDLEDGGVFVGIHRGKIQKDTSEYKTEIVISYIQSIIEHCELDIDRIYLLPRIRMESTKWFQKARQNGLWTNLFDYLKENVDIVVTEEMKQKYHSSHYYINTHSVPTYEWLKSITEGLGGTNSLFNELYNVVDEETSDYESLNTAIRFFGFSKLDFGDSSVDYKKMVNNILDAYPLLGHLHITGYSYLNEDKLRAIIEYVETVDVMKKTLTLEEELV